MAESRSSVPRWEALGYETGGRRGCTYLSHLWPRKDTTPALGQRSIYANPAHELAACTREKHPTNHTAMPHTNKARAAPHTHCQTHVVVYRLKGCRSPAHSQWRLDREERESERARERESERARERESEGFREITPDITDRAGVRGELQELGQAHANLRRQVVQGPCDLSALPLG